MDAVTVLSTDVAEHAIEQFFANPMRHYRGDQQHRHNRQQQPFLAEAQRRGNDEMQAARRQEGEYGRPAGLGGSGLARPGGRGPDLALRHMGQCTKSPPHEGCGSEFVIDFYVALDHPERADHARQAQTGRRGRDSPGAQQGNRLAVRKLWIGNIVRLKKNTHGHLAPVRISPRRRS